MVCFERVTSHSTYCAEPGRSEFTLGDGPVVLALESRFLVAAGETDEVGGLRGCERWGTVSLLWIVGFADFCERVREGRSLGQYRSGARRGSSRGLAEIPLHA